MLGHNEGNRNRWDDGREHPIPDENVVDDGLAIKTCCNRLAQFHVVEGKTRMVQEESTLSVR